METLVTLIRNYVFLDDSDLADILSHFEARAFKKKTKVLIAGQHVMEYYFVKSGGLRIYYHNGDQESTLWVAFKGNFFTEIESIWTQSPTRFYFEAIEDTELLVIGKNTMEQLYERYPAWQKFGRKIWEYMVVGMTPRVISLLNESAEERYLSVLQQEEIIQKLPLHQLSSLIGITPNSLSRLRREIAQKKDQ